MKIKEIKKMVKPEGCRYPLSIDESLKFYVESSSSIDHLRSILVTQVSEGDSEYIDFLMKQFQSNDIETLAKRIMKYYKDVICQNRQLIKFSYNHTFGFGFH